VGALLRHPKLADARKASERVLELVGLRDRTDVRAVELNVAGQKRVELARALATEPKMLLLDEVAGGLSPDGVIDTPDGEVAATGAVGAALEEHAEVSADASTAISAYINEHPYSEEEKAARKNAKNAKLAALAATPAQIALVQKITKGKFSPSNQLQVTGFLSGLRNRRAQAKAEPVAA